MLVTNGDIIRTMNNQNLAQFLYVLIEKIQKPYDASAVRHIEEWLNDDYYKSERGVTFDEV